ncbi:hypothetical protein I3F58_19130 [Streptomyces sp. MUM 203J]|nr:hypothetical protein [Streptomyces sp. MUM 203J]
MDVTPGRRRSPLAVSMIAAAVLLAGGGGTYLAVAAAGGDRGEAAGGAGNAAVSDSRGAAPPPSATDGDGIREPGKPGIAPGEPDPGGAAYQVRGTLPDGPGKAYTYRPKGSVDADDVARLARLLGVEGTPRKEALGWRVGPQKDGTGAVLRVDAEAPATWSYHVGGPASDDCPKGKRACPPDGGTRSGQPVSEAAAKKAAAPVLKGLGLEKARLDATQVTDSVRVVNADPVVAGLPTFDWSTGIRVGAGGELVGGSGRLLDPVKGSEYPVMSAEEAVRELNDSVGYRSRIGGCASPVPHEEPKAPDAPQAPDVPRPGSEPNYPDVMTGTGPSGTDPAVPCEPGSGSPVPPKERVTIRGAAFGLAGQLEKGAPALVPAWLFDAERENGERYRFAYPAVPVEKLAPEPERQNGHLRAERYEAEGRTLTVWFLGGACSRYTMRVEETATQVKVRLYGTPVELHRACIALAVELSDTVTLKAPLGDRKVVDAVTGEPVPRV